MNQSSVKKSICDLPIRLSDKIFSSYIFEKKDMMPFLRNRSTLFVAHVSH